MNTTPPRSERVTSTTVSTPHTGVLLEHRVVWSAVIAGTVLALAVQILLTMLGAGLGASTIDPLAAGDTNPSASAFGMGAAVWWLISSLIALFAGGWIAGRLAGLQRKGDGSIHGLLTWGLAVLATVYLLGTAASSLISGAGSVLGTAATVTATGAAAAAPKMAEMAGDQLDKSGISFDSIKREAMQLLQQTGKPNLQAGSIQQQAQDAAAQVKQAAATGATTDSDFSGMLQRLLTAGKSTANQVDRDAVINVVMARQNVLREEAAKTVQGWETTADQARVKAAQAAEQAKQKAKEVADATAKNVSRAMLMGFFALALGGLAAWWGGAMGQRRALVIG